MELIRYGIDERFVVPKDTENMLRQKGYKGRVNATYHEVVDWFESKGLYITAMHFDVREEPWTAIIDGKEHALGDVYTTREQALNAGILKALELI